MLAGGDTPNEAGFPPLLQLPHELLFEIISILSEPPDLLSLSLTCRVLNSHVVPYHTDYRILRVRTLNPTLFAHLARRTDLARNIREVHISERHNCTRGDRIPKKLVEMSIDGDPKTNGSGVPGPDGERVKVLNVCKALRCMSGLRSFTWEWNGVFTEEHGSNGSHRKRVVVRPTSEPRFEDAILAEVVRKPTLKHFGLSGPFGAHASGLSLDNKYEYPAWHLSNLTSLNISGDTWLKESNILPLCIMLSRSPNLECLTIPLEFRHLPVIVFPKLKKVKLHLLSGGTANVDASAAAFIENHPTIEELTWYPIGTPRLKKGVLPNLKSLRSTAGVVRALVESDTRLEEVEEDEAAEIESSLAVVSPPVIQTQAGMLSAASVRKHKRLSMIREADEPEEVEEDEDEEATPPAPSPILLTEDSTPPSSPSPNSPAQYVSYPPASSSSSSSSAYPTITLTAPPSTPTSACSGQQQDTSHRRPIESLEIAGLSVSTLLFSAPLVMDRNALRKFSVYTFADLQVLTDLADMFPNICWISLPSVHLPSSLPHPVPFTITELLDILPKFKNLEVFRGGALWRAAGSTSEDTKQRVHEALGVLVQKCPNLKEVDHCDWYERRLGYKRVVVTRDVMSDGLVVEGGVGEVEEVEVVSYGIKKPIVREYFDVLDGIFN